MALGLALSFVTAGCHPENMKTIPGSRQAPIDVSPRGPIDVVPMTPVDLSNSTNLPPMIPIGDTAGHPGWVENRDALKEYSAHFAYDSSALRSADKSKLASVADYLKANPTAAVRVEGNCDERGTEEYNRSLGERRALAGREALVGLGISSERVDTLSYGEDKPVDPAHNESAWKENRRDDFVVLTPPK